MNKESKEYKSNLDILEKHLGKDYYKIGHLHIMISQAMDEAVLNKSSDTSPIISESGSNPNLPKFRKPPPPPAPMPRTVQGTKRTTVCVHQWREDEVPYKKCTKCGLNEGQCKQNG